MAELSGLWTTSGTPSGDQQASYTQAQLATARKIVAACSGFEGVAPSFLNELAVSANGANTVAVATGGAVCDGMWFHNDASQNVNIPSATAGLTRIDRIVLRATWASFNVSVTRIAGTSHATPSAPSITQSSGTTYDIQLAQVLVTDAGVVTVTDERTWAIVATDGSTLEASAGTLRVKDAGITDAKLRNSVGVSVIGKAALSAGTPTDIVASSDGDVLRRSGATLGFGTIATAGIADDAVTQAKIADGSIDTARLANDAVDDTKVGNRVPQFYRRQGGSASNWSSAGTTTQTPTTVRMQAGVVSVNGSQAITFPTAFSQPPVVFATANLASYMVGVTNITASGCTLHNQRGDGTWAAIDVSWLAIGPE